MINNFEQSVSHFHFLLGPTNYVESLLQLSQTEFILSSSLFLHFFGTCLNHETKLHCNLIIIYLLSQTVAVDAVGTHSDLVYQPICQSPSCYVGLLLMAHHWPPENCAFIEVQNVDLCLKADSVMSFVLQSSLWSAFNQTNIDYH